MGNLARRGRGAAEEVKGKVKAGVGRAVGDRRMEAEGRARAAKGRVVQEVAKAEGRLRGKGQELVGKARQALNKE